MQTKFLLLSIFLVLCTIGFVLYMLYVQQAALSLETRPALHNSTLLLAINLCSAVICWCLHLSKSSYRTAIVLLCCMFAVTWTTHHLRDGLRRGSWSAPFGHTPALPKWLYLSATTTVPLTARIFMLTDVAGTDADIKSQLPDV